MKKLTFWTIGTLAALLAVLLGAVWLATFHPKLLQDEPITCAQPAPTLRSKQLAHLFPE